MKPKVLNKYVAVWFMVVLTLATVMTACVRPQNNPPEVTSQSVSSTTPNN